MVIPNDFPITPIPNFADYEPNDFYDLRPGPSSPINNTRTKSQWYDPGPGMKQKAVNDKYHPRVLPFFRQWGSASRFFWGSRANKERNSAAVREKSPPLWMKMERSKEQVFNQKGKWGHKDIAKVR